MTQTYDLGQVGQYLTRTAEECADVADKDILHMSTSLGSDTPYDTLCSWQNEVKRSLGSSLDSIPGSDLRRDIILFLALQRYFIENHETEWEH